MHVVRADAGQVHVFVYDPRKLVRSSLEELLPGARWRALAGPGGAEAMWDLRGRHSVHGEQPDSGVRLDAVAARRLLDPRLLLAGDSSSLVQLDRGVRLVELWAGRGRVSEAVAELGGRAVRLGYRLGQDFTRAADRAAVDGLVERGRPGTVLCAPMCGPWSPYSALNAAIHVGFARSLRLRRLGRSSFFGGCATCFFGSCFAAAMSFSSSRAPRGCGESFVCSGCFAWPVFAATTSTSWIFISALSGSLTLSRDVLSRKRLASWFRVLAVTRRSEGSAAAGVLTSI